MCESVYWSLVTDADFNSVSTLSLKGGVICVLQYSTYSHLLSLIFTMRIYNVHLCLEMTVSKAESNHTLTKSLFQLKVLQRMFLMLHSFYKI